MVRFNDTTINYFGESVSHDQQTVYASFSANYSGTNLYFNLNMNSVDGSTIDHDVVQADFITFYDKVIESAKAVSNGTKTPATTE